MLKQVRTEPQRCILVLQLFFLAKAVPIDYLCSMSFIFIVLPCVSMRESSHADSSAEKFPRYLELLFAHLDTTCGALCAVRVFN